MGGSWGGDYYGHSRIMALKKLRYDGWRKKIKFIQIRGGPGNLVTKWLVFLGGGGVGNLMLKC